MPMAEWPRVRCVRGFSSLSDISYPLIDKIILSYLISLSSADRIVVIEYFLGKTSRRSLTVWNSGAQRDALWVVVPLGTQAQRSANVRPR